MLRVVKIRLSQVVNFWLLFRSMTLVRWDLDAGASLPEHSHPHEQIMHLIDGSFEMTAGGRTSILEAGSVMVIPPNVPHSGKALAASRVIDVFHPVREDFRKKQAEYDSKAKGRE
jgi:quercetin dioxygenase-like cupin family protein